MEAISDFLAWAADAADALACCFFWAARSCRVKLTAKNIYIKEERLDPFRINHKVPNMPRNIHHQLEDSFGVSNPHHLHVYMYSLA